jgi:hypothetical protein
MLKKQSQTPRDDAFWGQHVKSWKKSGLSQAKYCEQKNLRLSVFGYWHRKLGSLDSKVKFVKLPASSPCAESILEIQMGAEIKIRVDAQFDPELLIHVLKALRGSL